ncbi:NCS2 family permease [Cytobacillus firmus]|jgi:AGZA family xanthine/uracil permease-like MFS transporter|uniref:NCS2 family permease n=2 Tax=Bacillaceae TaxID=186817 RepID=A0A0J5VPC5_CYTFI|nr:MULTISPECIES: NCS2 family permease [Bacillaceae]KAF0821932.1 Xanthine/uracil/thiamine/ascorbate permease family protein [Cytobacillus firmus]KML38959.1 guanine permease [Cytobacillus firmus]MBG9443080.1 guanine permease [Cytobacillus firmus]MBG9448208.1 guanine permease [Cytobacillus firmus]MBG9543980.1 guanine permease [Cytobacillus firmus]
MKKYFQFEELGTNYRREFIGGLTTFLAMAYILVVNPITLSLMDIPDLPDAMRMDYGAVFVATAVAAAIGSLLMGVLARYPIALAPGMGLNAFFAYTVVLTMGIPWQHALGGVLISGIIFIFLSLSGLREKIINSIPAELKYAVSAGIGLFITFVGAQSAGLIVNNDAVLVGLGDFTDGNVLLAIFGIVITVILMTKGIKGGIFIGMVITTVAGMIAGLIDVPGKVVDSVPSVAPTFGAAFGAYSDPSFFSTSMLVVVLTFLFVDFFDTAGTLVGVANQAGLMKENKLPRAGKALLADSTATVVGAIFGTSTTTSFIESSSGVAAGARTGFASIVTAGFFLLSLFFFPLLEVITSAVTAPALIIVGVLMVASLGNIDWTKFEIAVPAFLTIIAMPLTYSIATGIAIGFIFYPITMIVKGRIKEIHPIMYVLFVIFVMYFIFLK